jgi:hypothetical protein
VYGPYAENLRHVLTHIEGHFVAGYGDANDRPDLPITPNSRAIALAEKFLQNKPEITERLKHVERLIGGFETPYGMELLATLHWVAVHEDATNFDEAVAKTYAWNERKRMFTREHLLVAWNTLASERWIHITHVEN